MCGSKTTSYKLVKSVCSSTCSWLERLRDTRQEGQGLSLPSGPVAFPTPYWTQTLQSEPLDQVGAAVGGGRSHWGHLCHFSSGSARKGGQAWASVLCFQDCYVSSSRQRALRSATCILPIATLYCSFMRAVKALRSLACMKAEILSLKGFITYLSPPYSLRPSSVSSFHFYGLLDVLLSYSCEPSPLN